MPRAPRIWFPGAVYHVIQRGNDQHDIFREDKDRIWFLKTVRESKKEMGFKIYLYVLMANHYHITIEASQNHISEIMHYINSTYALRFNKKYARTGHLFQGRFKSILVDKDSYLLELSRYIHLNPVKAGIVGRPEDYIWSSYRLYLYPESEFSHLVDTELVLSWFGDDFQDRRSRYRDFVAEKLTNTAGGEDWLKLHIRKQRFLGDNTFIQMVFSKLKRGQAPFGQKSA